MKEALIGAIKSNEVLFDSFVSKIQRKFQTPSMWPIILCILAIVHEALMNRRRRRRRQKNPLTHLPNSTHKFTFKLLLYAIQSVK